MNEQQTEYLKDHIEYFIEKHSIPEEELGELFYYLSVVHFNVSLLTKEQFGLLTSLFISSNPSKPLSVSDIQLIQDIAVELKAKGATEGNSFVPPDVEYLQDEGDSRIFLSTSKQRYVFKQTKNNVKVKDIVTKSPLIEGGVKLLFRKW